MEVVQQDEGTLEFNANGDSNDFILDTSESLGVASGQLVELSSTNPCDSSFLRDFAAISTCKGRPNGQTGLCENNSPANDIKDLLQDVDNLLLKQSNALFSTNPHVGNHTEAMKLPIENSKSDCLSIQGERQSSSFYESKTEIRGHQILNTPESDSFECDLRTATAQDDVSSFSSILRKRNRQISTDSGSSVAVEAPGSRKPNKKTKKKDRKKPSEDGEIDRILAELETDRSRRNSVEGTSAASADVPSENLPPPDNQKRKKKKKLRSLAKKELDDDLSKPQVEVKDVLTSTQPVIEDVEPSSTREVDGKKSRRKPGKKLLAVMQAAVKKAKDDEVRFAQEEIAKQKRAEDVERLRLEQLKMEEERKNRKKQKEKDRKERLRAEGKFMTKSQKNARAKVEAALSAWREHGIQVPNLGEKKQDSRGFQKRRHASTRSLSSQEGSDSVSQDTDQNDGESRSQKSLVRQRHLTDPFARSDFLSSSSDAQKSISGSEPSLSTKKGANGAGELAKKVAKEPEKVCPKNEKEECPYRSPIVCVLGHVDTGKTKLLDKIRKTHVQDNEPGGITQQIGATMVPNEALYEKCNMAKSFTGFQLKLPGLLIIDTPGHESFRNLRSRGSSLCDIAVLVVDIMHGLEQQTIESIGLLKERKTPFVVALNKIDRLYEWQSDANADVQDVMKRQKSITFSEFDKRCKEVIAGLANQELNATLFYENTDPRSWISLVPVSAVSGDGMGNLLAVVCHLCQNLMSKQLLFSPELEATVLEVKTASGLGTTLDVILVNGHLKESDTIVLVGQDGPIVSQIRSLLMPQPLRELRVKNPYQEFKTVKGAQGVKVSGKDLDKSIAGLPLYVARSPDEVPVLKEKVLRVFKCAMNSIRLSDRGVYVQASTLGSLEALLDFLKSSKVPYAGVKVGPVVKKDVIKASVMLEHDVQYAVILAFDVKIEREAQELSEHLGIKIFQADIIYHLFDNFTRYREELDEKRKNDLKKLVVFPCKLRILPEYIFSHRDPIVLGIRVEAGILRLGTPICVPSKNFVQLGTVANIEVQSQSVESAKEGDDVCIKIEPGDDNPKTYGRHFDHEDLLVSKISRQTIDVCKEFHRDQLQKSDWNLMVELKKLFLIA